MSLVEIIARAIANDSAERSIHAESHYIVSWLEYTKAAERVLATLKDRDLLKTVIA